METVQFIQTSPQQLKELISNDVREQLEELKKNFQTKEPNQYLSRNDVAEMLSIDLSTVHNWTKKGILQAKQIGGRIFYLRYEVENAIVKLKK
jgi:DNA invertase Pin-like site-specific DNA recombinase